MLGLIWWDGFSEFWIVWFFVLEVWSLLGRFDGVLGIVCRYWLILWVKGMWECDV